MEKTGVYMELCQTHMFFTIGSGIIVSLLLLLLPNQKNSDSLDYLDATTSKSSVPRSTPFTISVTEWIPG